MALGRIHRKVLSVCSDPQSRGTRGTVAQANTVAGMEGGPTRAGPAAQAGGVPEAGVKGSATRVV